MSQQSVKQAFLKIAAAVEADKPLPEPVQCISSEW